MESNRKDFLIAMYNQMFNDINRHIIVIWQSAGVVVGAFAIFALVEKHVISLDIATSIILLLSCWMLAHLLDAAYWYNRNLVIIANIERQFLTKEDLKGIHYYFGAHRPKNKMITHLVIQKFLGISLGVLVLFYHFSQNVWPGFSSPFANFETTRCLPYIVTIVSGVFLCKTAKSRNESYAEFMRNSPGKAVDSKGIEYGIGHGHPAIRSNS